MSAGLMNLFHRYWNTWICTTFFIFKPINFKISWKTLKIISYLMQSSIFPYVFLLYRVMCACSHTHSVNSFLDSTLRNKHNFIYKLPLTSFELQKAHVFPLNFWCIHNPLWSFLLIVRLSLWSMRLESLLKYSEKMDCAIENVSAWRLIMVLAIQTSICQGLLEFKN